MTSPLQLHYLYEHWRYLHFCTHCCSSWFKTQIIDRHNPTDDNRAQHRGAIITIQYPERKVLAKLTQGQRDIWTQGRPQTKTVCFISIPYAQVWQLVDYGTVFVFFFLLMKEQIVTNRLLREYPENTTRRWEDRHKKAGVQALKWGEILSHSVIKYDRLNMQRPYKSPIWFLLLLHPRCVLFSLPRLLILWHLMYKATQRSTHTCWKHN